MFEEGFWDENGGKVGGVGRLSVSAKVRLSDPDSIVRRAVKGRRGLGVERLYQTSGSWRGWKELRSP